MSNTLKTAGLSALVASIVCLVGFWLVGGNQQPAVGGSRFPNGLSADGTTPSAGQVRGTTLKVTGAATLDTSLALGASGTTQTQQIATTCNPSANVSISATTTGYISCTGVTGVTSSSLVYATFSTSTNALADQWWITGVKASSTAGAIDFKIYNGTGANAVPSAASTVASSTRIWIVN